MIVSDLKNVLSKTKWGESDPHLETNLISAQETVQDFDALYGEGKEIGSSVTLVHVSIDRLFPINMHGRKRESSRCHDTYWEDT
jgi:hypothetical protein